MSNHLHGIVAVAAMPSQAGRFPVRAVPSAPAAPIRPGAPGMSADQPALADAVTPGSAAAPGSAARSCVRRASVRDELDAALAGAPVTGRDRQFLSRLVHWDKRNAASVLSLLRQARLAGRTESALSPAQLETVLAALEDAVIHRVASVEAVACWDCDKTRGGRCADHARDFERARDYAELAALLSAVSSATADCAAPDAAADGPVPGVPVSVNAVGAAASTIMVASSALPARSGLPVRHPGPVDQGASAVQGADRPPMPIARPTDLVRYRRRAPIVS